jgi:hypothetical protein
VPDPCITLTNNGDGACDLVCRECGASSRLHPDETFVDQVRMFLDQHRHHARSMN